MRFLLPLFPLLMAACAGAALPRVQAPSPRDSLVEPAPRAQSAGDEAATQQWLRDEVNRQRGESAPTRRPGQGQETVPFAPAPSRSVDGEASVRRAQTNDDASSAWLRESADERRAAYEAGVEWQAPSSAPAQQTTTVERTVYVDRYAAPVGYGYDCYGNPVYYSGYARPYRSTFPVYTVTGATIGAFSSGCRSNGNNIAIGAGIGLLFDIASCW